jgi:hypothetical protein
MACKNPLSGRGYITGVMNMATVRKILMMFGMSLKTAPMIDKNIPIPTESRSRGNKVRGNKKAPACGVVLVVSHHNKKQNKPDEQIDYGREDGRLDEGDAGEIYFCD